MVLPLLTATLSLIYAALMVTVVILQVVRRARRTPAAQVFTAGFERLVLSAGLVAFARVPLEVISGNLGEAYLALVFVAVSVVLVHLGRRAVRLDKLRSDPDAGIHIHPDGLISIHNMPMRVRSPLARRWDRLRGRNPVIAYYAAPGVRAGRWLPYRPRRLNRAYAAAFGFFWRPCPLCGRDYGGHEDGGPFLPSSVPDPLRQPDPLADHPATFHIGICPRCARARRGQLHLPPAREATP